VAVCAVNWTIDGRICCLHCSSHQLIASYSPRIATCAYPPAFDAPVTGGRHRNIATTFDIEKLEWCGYSYVKEFWRCRYADSFRQNVRTWQTDRYHM